MVPLKALPIHKRRASSISATSKVPCLSGSAGVWKPHCWRPLPSTSRNSSLSFTRATAWRPRRSSPSSVTLPSTSALPSVISRLVLERRISAGYKDYFLFLLVNQPCHTSTDNMVFSKVLEVQVGGKVKLYTA